MVSVFIVEIADVDEDIKHVRTDIIFQRIPDFFIIVSNIEFSHKIEQVDLLNLATVCKMVEKLADVGGTRNESLKNSTEGLKDGGVVDGSEEKLYFSYIDIIFSYFFLEFDQVFTS